MAESEEELKSLLMQVKEENEKAGLRLNTQKTKILACIPINSWQIDGETMETVTNFIFWSPKSLQMVIEAMNFKRCLLLGRKAMTNLDNILKSRDITSATKVHLVKAMVFPAFMYECENWITKKAECQRTDTFQLGCWRSKEIKPVNPKVNQPWIFIGRTNAEAPILWPPDTKSQLFGKDPDAGKEKGAAEDEMVR